MIDPIIRINISGLPDAQDKIMRIPSLINRVIKDPDTLTDIGRTLLTSARTTLEQGGRPLYKPLAQSTINRRWGKEQKLSPSRRSNRQGIVSNQPLNNTGRLIQSLGFSIEGDGLYLTSVDYLKYHQWEEGRIKARFPARPVWGVHDDDRDKIADIITNQLGNAITSLT
ncbi:MAG: hypothetical protein HGB04_01650 [Chlorobiaceae bacterium]|nr:hypothetical protein [Chlorobiaceae bacterium]